MESIYHAHGEERKKRNNPWQDYFVAFDERKIFSGGVFDDWTAVPKNLHPNFFCQPLKNRKNIKKDNYNSLGRRFSCNHRPNLIKPPS